MRQIKVSSKGNVEHKPVTDGMLSIGGGADDEEEPVELVVEGLEEYDADADEFDIEDTWEIADESAAPGGSSACAMSLEL